MKPKKPKKCICGCEATFIPSAIGQKWVNMSHRINWLLNSEAGQKEMEKAKIKAKKKLEKEEREKDNVIREKLKTLGQYEAEAKREFQKWIRKRDENQPCISCGTLVTDLWDGGHYKKAEIYSGVIFDEMNCTKQCRKCNRFLGGNELNYRDGLIKRHGEDYVLEIEKKANDTRNYKFTKEELKEIRDKYKKLNK